jgi:molybdopterin synthase catalytic subunit
MHIELTQNPINIQSILENVQSEHLGGIAVFIGRVRSLTNTVVTEKIEYSAYDDMALKQLQNIASEAEERYCAQVAVVHRIGKLLPGDIAVVTMAAAQHRAEAFECCRYLIEKVKYDIPIWKEEFGPDGAVIIEGENRLPTETNF